MVGVKERIEMERGKNKIGWGRMASVVVGVKERIEMEKGEEKFGWGA